MNGQLTTSANFREKKLLKVPAKAVEFIYVFQEKLFFKECSYLAVLFKDILPFLMLEHLRNDLGI